MRHLSEMAGTSPAMTERRMPAFICTACGTQYSNAANPPAHCVICEEERQYVPPRGQTWTTMEALAREGQRVGDFALSRRRRTQYHDERQARRLRHGRSVPLQKSLVPSGARSTRTSDRRSVRTWAA